MERYEINKYFDIFNQKIKDLYIALSIEKNRPILKNYEEEIASPDFWVDQKRAQSIISSANAIKDKINDYDSIVKNFEYIKELDELSEVDVEARELLETEILAFEKSLTVLEEKALLSGKYDMNDAILEIHPGAGGTESMDWADMLFRMYQRFCTKKDFKFTVLDFLPGDEAGIKSVTVSIKGKFAYGLLKGERGVHRLVRISPFDSNSRRHTSFASIDVAPQIEENDDIVIPDEDLRIDTFCSSGPGGQGVNTTYSAVRLTHLPTNISVACQKERSQIKNKEIAMKILKSKLLDIQIKNTEKELKELKGEQNDIAFGSQIRSYVFCPYTLVKDHRTNFEVGNVNAVMDGEIDGFIDSYLKLKSGD